MQNNLSDIDQKIKFNIRKILKGQLALEDYLDLRHVKKDPDSVSIAFKKIHEYRQLKPTLTNEKLLELTNKVCESLEKAYDELGRENFTFYDDGCVEYNG